MKKLNLNNKHYISYKQQKTGDLHSPTIVFLHGLMSDKNATKALSIEKFCIKNKYNYVAFDNLGHGESSGNFTHYTLTDWLNSSLEIIKRLELQNIILVGSSMGGWLALLIGLIGMDNIKALLLLAPAPDFTEKIWSLLSTNDKSTLKNNDYVTIKATADFSGIPITYKLIEDGKNHLLLNKQIIPLKMPTIIIHGMQDEDVDYEVAELLRDKISNSYSCLKLLKYSGHRLSSPQDLLLINNSLLEIITLITQVMD